MIACKTLFRSFVSLGSAFFLIVYFTYCKPLSFVNLSKILHPNNLTVCETSSCLHIPVVQFSCFGTPIIHAEIEGVTYPLEVDLGMAQQLYINRKFLCKIKKKQKKTNMISRDIRNNLYETPSFQIPSIRFQNWEIKDITASEQSEQDQFNNIFWVPSEKLKHQILKKDEKIRKGTIGWPIFSHFDCFFDLAHASIFIGKDMTSLLDAGCSIEGFIQLPFDIDKGGIILFVTTDLGINPFLLDTGASYSIIKKNLIKQENIYQITPEIEGYQTHLLSFNGKNLGKWTFRLLEISDFYDQFDGILGMDFFKKHAVCLDFHNKIAYIQP